MCYRKFTVLIALLLVLTPAHSFAHEIPSDILVRMFVKPEGQRLRVLIRVPLKSIAEITWPETRPGLLDVDRAEPQLREAALTKIAPKLEIFEENRPLAEPRVVAVKASFPSDRSFDSYEQALARITGPESDNDLE